MAKKNKTSLLVCSRPERCIGCRLCCIHACLVKNNPISLAKSFIKVAKKDDATFSVTIDYGTRTNYKEIVSICPKKCFEIIDN